jgi:hypothetical protein
MTSATKICYQCGEEIKEIARKCPHCQSWQTGIGAAMANPAKAALLAIVPMLFILLWSWFWIGPRRDKNEFEKHRAEVTVTSSKMTWSKEEDGNFISIIGTLKNDGNVKWNNLQLEAQYFNPAGILIDTQSDRNYDIILLPHSEHAFRMRDYADKPASEYATHKVFIRDAENAAKWP